MQTHDFVSLTQLDPAKSQLQATYTFQALGDLLAERESIAAMRKPVVVSFRHLGITLEIHSVVDEMNKY
jgi:hypothetical protein